MTYNIKTGKEIKLKLNPPKTYTKYLIKLISLVLYWVIILQKIHTPPD